MYESVAIDDTGITSIGWQTYPILRFNSVPDSIEVHRPARPALLRKRGSRTGTGGVANAIANATGKRLRNLPRTRKRIKDAIEA